MRAAIVSLALACAAAFGQTAASQPEQKKPAAAPKLPAVESKSGDGGLNTGIKVHGHWVIDVLNPDKTLVSHHEFENGLLALPSIYTASFHLGTAVPGGWAVFLSPDPTLASASNTLLLEQAGATYPSTAIYGISGIPLPACPGTSCSSSLTVGPTSGGTAIGLVLSGNATAPSAGTINTVATLLATCSPSSGPVPAPAACLTINASTGNKILTPYTQANLTASTTPPPISYAAGQIVQATVTLSFCSPNLTTGFCN